jgi:hypothetical protein
METLLKFLVWVVNGHYYAITDSFWDPKRDFYVQ